MNINDKSKPSDDTDPKTAPENEQQYGRFEQSTNFNETLVAYEKDGSTLATSAPTARLLVTGGSTRWNTGFPDWRNKESYSGTIRIQSVNGEIMICRYIESATKADCSIVYGEIPGRLIEARDTDTVGYGADTRVVEGHHAWSTWVKFHYQEYIYSGMLTCYC